MRAIDRASAILDAAAVLAVCVLLGGASAPELFAAVAVHEAAHAAVIAAAGVRRVRFSPSGAGFRLKYAAASLSRRARAAVCLAGVAANAALAAASLVFGAYRFAAVNLSLAAFNLLPIEGLDGGDALSLALERLPDPAAAHRVCRAASLAFTLALWTLSVYVELCVAPNPGVILAATALVFRELTRR